MKAPRKPHTNDVWTLTETFQHPGKRKRVLKRDVFILKIDPKRSMFTCLAAARSHGGDVATLRTTKISIKTWERQSPVFRRTILK